MTANYRKATKKDLDVLCLLWDKLNKSHIKYHQSYLLAKNHPSTLRKFLKERLEDKKSLAYLAEHQGKIIGFVLGRIKERPPIFKLKREGSISDVFVEENYRKKGIGCELTKILLKEFSRKKLKLVGLTVDVDNPAVEFYQRLGFKKRQLRMHKDL